MASSRKSVIIELTVSIDVCFDDFFDDFFYKMNVTDGYKLNSQKNALTLALKPSVCRRSRFSLNSHRLSMNSEFPQL